MEQEFGKYSDSAEERLKEAGIAFSPEELKEYKDGPCVSGVIETPNTELVIPQGYKRCGGCGRIIKLYAFSKNRSSKLNCAGNCRSCQNKSSTKSYAKTKERRNYKEYYALHKDKKQAHAKKYYEANKESLKDKTKAYHTSKRGKKVMQKSHNKRRKAKIANAGIPYTRAMVIERDSIFIERPNIICYLCGEPILDTTGIAMHLDHVLSINNGGKDCFTNMAGVHSKCNLVKTKSDEEVTASVVNELKIRSQAYMDKYPAFFES